MNIDESIVKLRRYYQQHRRLPSYKEMSDLFGYSSKFSSLRLVNKLIKEGILGKDEKGKLFPKSLFTIPNLGSIKAGYPSPVDAPGEHDLDPYHFILNLPANPFVVTVSGDSMIGAFLNEGDICIIDPDAQPKVGDIVAALVDGETTLKYLSRKDGKYYLHPANEDYPDIPLTDTSLIQGVLRKVLREY